MTGGKTSVEQGQSGVKEEWECRACTQVDRKQSRERYTETASQGRVSRNQLTEGLIMKTRHGMEGCPDCR